MNNIDDILQERLERLEAGESLADCLVGLSPEDAELLQLASQLRQFEAPLPVAANVATQRAAILSATPAPPPSNIKEEVGLLALLANFFHSPTRIAGAVALAVVAVLAIGLWLNRPNTTPELAQNIDKETAVSAESANDTKDTSAATTASDTSVDVVASVAEDPGSTAFLPVLSMALPQGPQLTSLTDIQGLVEIQETDGSWQAVTGMHALETGTLVRTGALSSAKLTFFDNSVATLGPETGLTLEQIDAKLPGEGFRTVVLNQWQGQSNHDVQFRNDAGSHYEVITPDGSGLARGTEFQVDVLPEQLSRISVTEGRVDVTGNQRTVSVTPGKLTTIPADEVPTTPAFSITGQGELSAIGDAWIIAGQAFIVNENTTIVGDPQVGDEVFVSGYIAADGQNIANHIELIQESPENQFSLTGTVSDMDDDTWIVSGQTIHIDADADIDEDIAIDDLVHVVGFIDEDSTLVATTISQLPEDDELPFTFTGVVQQIGDESWQISGVTIQVNEETAVSAGIQVGDIVKVDGIILDEQDWLATSIELVDTTLATFSITGAVQSMDPWQVAGIPFTTNEDTLIDADIMVDDIVQVTGRILADGTWLADTIQLLDDDFLLEIVFAGIVDEMNPWIVNGLPLDTNEASQIDDDIEVGDLVRVTARILEDGTWLATRIDRLRGEIEEGCVSITAVVTQIGNGTLVLSNGSSFDMAEVEVDGTLEVGSVVMIIACVADDGSIEIEEIIILYTPVDTPPSDDGDDNDGSAGGSTTICHKPGTPAEKTKTVPESALGGHLGHGDTLGACP